MGSLIEPRHDRASSPRSAHRSDHPAPSARSGPLQAARPARPGSAGDARKADRAAPRDRRNASRAHAPATVRSGASVNRAASDGPVTTFAAPRREERPEPVGGVVDAGAGTQSRSNSALPSTASMSPDANAADVPAATAEMPSAATKIFMRPGYSPSCRSPGAR